MQMPEHLGGALALAAAVLQRGQDQLPLDDRQRRAQRHVDAGVDAASDGLARMCGVSIGRPFEPSSPAMMKARWMSLLAARARCPASVWLRRRCERGRRERLAWCPRCLLSSSRKCCGQQLDVVAALAQRRQRGSGTRSGGSSRSSRSLPSRDRLARVAVGGGDHAHVDLDRRASPPTRMNVPVSSTRSSLTCSSSGISVISSRNSVPPLARSK